MNRTTAATLAAGILAHIQAVAIHHPESAARIAAATDATTPDAAPSSLCAPDCEQACKCGIRQIDGRCIKLPIINLSRKLAAIGFLALAVTGFAFADSTIEYVSADDVIGDGDACECFRWETYILPADLPRVREALRRERQRNAAIARINDAP